ncbi:acylphosphatase [Treponema pedis]|uniref:acylphosphatase n=1 Tax=Treponema pedis TaxID=409322 RepID=UPI00040D0BE1|nr:acylphosphatase [Treponema pedis]
MTNNGRAVYSTGEEEKPVSSLKKEVRAFRIIVKGRVQGVGFRYWTVTLANRLGVTGWVRNCPDYSVEIFAEAGTQVLGEFMYELKHNHPRAKVETLTSEEIRVQGFKNFSVG